MKKYFGIICLLIASSFLAEAQIVENFSGFNLQNNLDWWGSKDSFQITQSTAIPTEMRPALQLNAASTGKSYLATTLNLASYDTIVWDFWAKLSFTPTTGNYARFYLLSENQDLTLSPSGIFVSLGENQKSVALFRKTATKTDTLIRAYPLTKTTNSIRIQIKYTIDKGWEFFADSLGGHELVKYGSSQELCPNYLYAGLFCCYTSSNSTKIYFDDISIKSIVKDTVKPFIEKIQVEYPNNVQVYFSEDIDPNTVFNELNYWVDKRIGEPLYVEYTSKKATLVFAEFLTTDFYNLTITGLKDLEGNEMNPKQFSFFYALPECLLINEVLFNPKQGCASFVEVYNNSGFDIPLENLCLSGYDKTKDLLKTVALFPPSYILKKDDYVVFTSNALAVKSCYTILDTSKIVELTNFPSLLKTEGVVVLARTDSTIIDRLDYSEKMHFSLLKEVQGVSLERKFLKTPTQDASNWTSATEEVGWATPAYKNSQFEGGTQISIKDGEIIINEVLFNPKEGGGAFVEIYNKTDRDIPLKYFCVATFDKTKGLVKSLSAIQENYVLPANDYVVLTKVKELVTDFYSTPYPEKIIQMETFPSYTKTEGTVILALPDSTIIDWLDYSEKMHFSLLKEVQGVSLERRYFDKPTQEISNWQSTAQSVGWATPTGKNSQYQEQPYTEDIITVDPELFTPNNDGKDDQVNFYYKLGKTGLLGNVAIYSAKGLKVKTLQQNELLGTSGSFSWNGLDENEKKCPIGFYILLIEFVDIESGQNQKFKKIFVMGV